MGKTDEYKIGSLCVTDRKTCEVTYFKEQLNKIQQLSNKERTYFSNIIIDNDQFDYEGNCPCPYNSDARGNSCGGRSSYSKNGQISYCYDSDVSDSQIIEKKAYMIELAENRLDNDIKKNINVYNQKYTLFIIFIAFGILWFYNKNGNKLN